MTEKIEDTNYANFKDTLENDATISIQECIKKGWLKIQLLDFADLDKAAKVRKAANTSSESDFKLEGKYNVNNKITRFPDFLFEPIGNRKLKQALVCWHQAWNEKGREICKEDVELPS